MDNSVIRKLADIDNAARSILDDAEEEKKRLAEDYREQTEAYDRKIDIESEQQLEKIRSDFERENTREIEKLEENMDKAFAFVNRNYAEKVDERADEIVARILES